MFATYHVSAIIWLQMAALLCQLEMGQGVCPAPCKCSLQTTRHLPGRLHTATCTNSKLTTVPLVPADTAVLLLKGNALQSIDGHLLTLLSLQELDISHNRIIILGEKPIFQNLSKIEYLDVSYNRLKILLHGTFSGLKKLHHLKLSHNQLNHVEADAFAGLNHLASLDLSYNQLESLNPRWFEDMYGLHILHLRSNHITDIKPNLFKQLSNLNALDLENNSLSYLSKQSFVGLEMLSTLSLKHNNFTTIPSKALRIFKNLKILSFDENPITELSKSIFSRVFVTELSLSNMPQLRFIDDYALTDMPLLTILHIHDNPELMYVSPQAFRNLPALTHLYLHNNHIIALPKNLVINMTNLRELHFYHNPLQCDCNARWLRMTLQNGIDNTTSNQNFGNHTMKNITFRSAYQIVCATPRWLAGRPLLNVQMRLLPKFCPPTVLPFFKDNIQVALDSSIRYECRGIGVPMPHIHWILPSGKILNSSSNLSRLRHEEPGTVELSHVKTTDAGTFSCMATNLYGYDTTSTVLGVHSTNIQILPLGVASTFITVTWNGTERTVATTDYQIQYHRQVRTNQTTSHSIHLRPYMRTYTVSNLQPNTVYQFCIAYKERNHLIQLNCINISTRNKSYSLHGIYNIKNNMSITIGLSTALALLLTLCLVGFVFHRHHRRKSYHEPTSSPNISSKVEGMSSIPLESLYHPASTPLCTSRTSLIRSSAA